MSIISVYFLLFLLVLVVLYYGLPAKIRPYVLLLGNIMFYLTFDWRYFLFLLFSIATTWAGAIKIEHSSKKTKKKWLIAVLTANIGLLFAVKYIPYLFDRVSSLFHINNFTVSLLVPIGISFYTLQVAGYVIDVYRGKYSAQRNFFKYMLFASFFPLILQGPISRYDQLAPQLYKDTRDNQGYDHVTRGAQLMLWGYFKKLMIADRAAIAVNAFYSDYTQFGSLLSLVAVLCYAIQIYADFSGCVDICRGAGQMFGIDIMDNFKQPYFATSVQGFWKRWHISLSSWFRDYLYIPLGGNRKGMVRKYVNVLLVFLVSGIWHGVGLHFIVWGILHGVYQIIGAVTLPVKKKLCAQFKINRESFGFKSVQCIFTFALINVAWIFFRAPRIKVALGVLLNLFSAWGVSYDLTSLGLDTQDWIVLLLSVSLLLLVSVLQYKGIKVQEKVASIPLVLRWSIYLLGFLLVLIFGIYGPGYSDASFIYMNF